MYSETPLKQLYLCAYLRPMAHEAPTIGNQLPAKTEAGDVAKPRKANSVKRKITFTSEQRWRRGSWKKEAAPSPEKIDFQGLVHRLTQVSSFNSYHCLSGLPQLQPHSFLPFIQTHTLKCDSPFLSFYLSPLGPPPEL